MEFFVAGESASSNAFSQLTRQIRMVTLCTTNFNSLKILRCARQNYLSFVVLSVGREREGGGGTIFVAV
jgi:hypothetical protein